jgi:hypothetical protein
MNPVNATFTPPTSNVDGSAVTADEIVHYNLQVGLVAADPTTQTYPTSFHGRHATTNTDGTVSIPLSDLGNLTPGSYVGIVSAVTSGGVASAPSPAAAFTIVATPVVTPNPPTALAFA